MNENSDVMIPEKGPITDELLGRMDRWFRAANDNKITNFKFWQEDNHVENIYSYDFYRQKLDYIHQNPVRQEIVARAEDYMYSSARNYAGMEGLLKVIVAK